MLLLLVALIIWLYLPKTEIHVYFPWFLQQVENDNIKSISIRGTEIHGELRKPQRYLNPPSVDTTIRKFYTHAQTEESIEPTIQKLTDRNKKNQTNPVLIDTRPPK